MPENPKPPDSEVTAGMADFFESDEPMDCGVEAARFVKKVSAMQKADHPDMEMPENTIVYELLSNGQVDELCDEIADIIVTSPGRYRLDLLAAFIEAMSVQLERDDGPPVRFFHPVPEGPARDFARSQALFFQIHGKVETMDWELRHGELGRVIQRLTGTMRRTLAKLKGGVDPSGLDS